MSSSNLRTRNYDEDDPQADQILQSMEHLRMPKDQLQFDEPRQALGRGGFGIVERAVFHAPNTDPIIVAVKRIPARSASLNRLKKRTGREIFIWSKLSHANIIPFLGYEWNEAAEEVWLVCPWQSKGTVRDYLKASLADIEQRLKLIIHTAEALHYLHTLNPPVCHGDIKAANVLVTENEDAMLTDFGLSRIPDDSLAKLETTRQIEGSIPWCSPEIFEADDYIRSPPCDVWAWAWLVTEIITGKVPFGNSGNALKVIQDIRERKWTVNAPDASFNGLSELWDTLLLCWNGDPALREKMAHCLNAVRALKPPKNYVAPELVINEGKSSDFEPSQSSNDNMAPRNTHKTQQSKTPVDDFDSCLEADFRSHKEFGGHLAPPQADRQSSPSGGSRPSSPDSKWKGHNGAPPGGAGSVSPRGPGRGAGSRSPSPGPQGFQPDVDLRETGVPRDLTDILSRHSWSNLRRYDEPNSVFRTSLIPGSRVMATVCVTQIYRTKTEKTAAGKRLMEELTQHRRKLTSPNIAHWVGFGFISPMNYACLVRYQEPGSLRLPDYLTEHPSADRFGIVKQVANGLECLHSNGVVHGDLRTLTFVVNVDGTVQVAGFGLVELLRVVPEDLFTIRMSPLEVLRGSPPTFASDIYAFANIALEVLTGCQPFIKLVRDTTVIGALYEGGHPLIESYPDFPNKGAIWELFIRCWEVDPAKRPVMAEVNKMLLKIAR